MSKRSLPVQLTLWINEKMLTAQDTSYDEARNLHSKWLKHQAFMAELQANKGWLENIDQVCLCVSEQLRLTLILTRKLNQDPVLERVLQFESRNSL